MLVSPRALVLQNVIILQALVLQNVVSTHRVPAQGRHEGENDEEARSVLVAAFQEFSLRLGLCAREVPLLAGPLGKVPRPPEDFGNGR